MELQNIFGQTIENVHFKESRQAKAEYDGCRFVRVDFNLANLSGFRFLDCQFRDCNLSLAALDDTVFSEIRFIDCKLLGLHFDRCSPYGLSLQFENCVVEQNSFYRLSLRKTVFSNCRILESDFTEADLTEAVFDHCDLSGTQFDQTILENSDFRSAVNFTIDPGKCRLKKAKFSLGGLPGLLSRYDLIIE